MGVKSLEKVAPQRGQAGATAVQAPLSASAATSRSRPGKPREASAPPAPHGERRVAGRPGSSAARGQAGDRVPPVGAVGRPLGRPAD